MLSTPWEQENFLKIFYKLLCLIYSRYSLKIKLKQIFMTHWSSPNLEASVRCNWSREEGSSSAWSAFPKLWGWETLLPWVLSLRGLDTKCRVGIAQPKDAEGQNSRGKFILRMVMIKIWLLTVFQILPQVLHMYELTTLAINSPCDLHSWKKHLFDITEQAQYERAKQKLKKIKFLGSCHFPIKSLNPHPRERAYCIIRKHFIFCRALKLSITKEKDFHSIRSRSRGLCSLSPKMWKTWRDCGGKTSWRREQLCHDMLAPWWCPLRAVKVFLLLRSFSRLSSWYSSWPVGVSHASSNCMWPAESGGLSRQVEHSLLSALCLLRMSIKLLSWDKPAEETAGSICYGRKK